jgi:hypothetical protein
MGDFGDLFLLVIDSVERYSVNNVGRFRPHFSGVGGRVRLCQVVVSSRWRECFSTFVNGGATSGQRLRDGSKTADAAGLFTGALPSNKSKSSPACRVISMSLTKICILCGQYVLNRTTSR